MDPADPGTTPTPHPAAGAVLPRHERALPPADPVRRDDRAHDGHAFGVPLALPTVCRPTRQWLGRAERLAVARTLTPAPVAVSPDLRWGLLLLDRGGSGTPAEAATLSARRLDDGFATALCLDRLDATGLARLATGRLQAAAFAFARRRDRLLVQGDGFCTVWDLVPDATRQGALPRPVRFPGQLAGLAEAQAVDAMLAATPLLRPELAYQQLAVSRRVVLLDNDGRLQICALDADVPRPRGLTFSPARVSPDGSWCLAALPVAPRVRFGRGAPLDPIVETCENEDAADDVEAPASEAERCQAAAYDTFFRPAPAGSLTLVRLTGPTPSPAAVVRFEGHHPAFAADGAWLFAPRAAGLDVWDLAPPVPVPRHIALIWGSQDNALPLIARHGRTALGRQPTGLAVWDLAHPRWPPRTLAQAQPDDWPAALSADGEIAITCARRADADGHWHAALWRLAGRTPRRTALAITALAWCIGSDPTRAFVLHRDGGVWAHELLASADAPPERLGQVSAAMQTIAVCHHGRALLCRGPGAATLLSLPIPTPR